MPTAYPRLPLTRTPEVDELLAVGRRRWPGARSAAAVMLNLAREGARAIQAEKSAPVPAPADHGLLIRRSHGRYTVTSQMVREALDDD